MAECGVFSSQYVFHPGLRIHFPRLPAWKKDSPSTPRRGKNKKTLGSGYAIKLTCQFKNICVSRAKFQMQSSICRRRSLTIVHPKGDFVICSALAELHSSFLSSESYEKFAEKQQKISQYLSHDGPHIFLLSDPRDLHLYPSGRHMSSFAVCRTISDVYFHLRRGVLSMHWTCITLFMARPLLLKVFLSPCPRI